MFLCLKIVHRDFLVDVCVELVHIVWISQHYVIVQIRRMASVCCGSQYWYRKSERNLRSVRNSQNSIPTCGTLLFIVD